MSKSQEQTDTSKSTPNLFNIKTREGDFLELDDFSIFEVKGFQHPPNCVIAYPRYIPNKFGDRIRNNVRYHKIYTLKEKNTVLRNLYSDLYMKDPFFSKIIPSVPINKIRKFFQPQDTLSSLSSEKKLVGLRKKSVNLAEIISSRSGIHVAKFGLSGSIMVNLDQSNSDIDLIIYGSAESQKISKTVQELMVEGTQICRHSGDNLNALYNFRSKDSKIGYHQFINTEKRKSNQGIFDGTEFFIRYLKEWSEVNELYGANSYNPVGYGLVSATIQDDVNSLFTPCIYDIEDVTVISGSPKWDIRHVISYRGRFAEQAKKSEKVKIQGRVEQVQTKGESYYQLILGESPEDFLIPISYE